MMHMYIKSSVSKSQIVSGRGSRFRFRSYLRHFHLNVWLMINFIKRATAELIRMENLVLLMHD